MLSFPTPLIYRVPLEENLGFVRRYVMKPSVLLALATASLWAEGLSQGERDFALSHLHASSKLLLDSISGLSEAQWKFKPAPDRWSIAEVAEHITLTEDMLFGMAKKMLESEPVPDRKVERSQDEELLKRMVDRSTRVKNPEPLTPTGKWATPEEVAAAFKERRNRVIEYVQTTRDDLRRHVRKFGDREQDAYQMILALAGHAERHVAQIQEVKADPGYPK
jgi:hypothetical protein